MKKALIILAIASICIVCGSCKKNVDYFHYSRNLIDNKSSYSFEVVAEASEQSILDLKNVPNSHSVESNALSEWIAKSSRTEGVNPVVSGSAISYSFCFENGVRHTFQGEIIENDFRSENSWTCNREGAKNDSEGSVYNTYTYTFTNEDYQRIMALYE